MTFTDKALFAFGKFIKEYNVQIENNSLS